MTDEELTDSLWSIARTISTQQATLATLTSAVVDQGQALLQVATLARATGDSAASQWRLLEAMSAGIGILASNVKALSESSKAWAVRTDRIADSVEWTACPQCGRCRSCHQEVTCGEE